MARARLDALVSLARRLALARADAAANPQRKRSCILLWMNGGPATIDLFDLKVGHENGGPFKEIQTARERGESALAVEGLKTLGQIVAGSPFHDLKELQALINWRQAIEL